MRARTFLAFVVCCVWLHAIGASVAAVAPLTEPWRTGTFALSDSKWVIADVDGQPVRRRPQSDDEPSLWFPREGGVVLHGCNSYYTSLTSSGSSLTFAPGGARTLMMCGDEDAQDERLENALLATKTYREEGGILSLLDDGGRVRLRLHRLVPGARTGQGTHAVGLDSSGGVMRVKLLEDAITLFVVINPIGLVPLFSAITRGEPPDRRRRIAGRAVLISAGIFIVFIALGQIVLEGLKVSLPAFRVAGGLVLLVVALKMVLHPGGDDGAGRGAP